MGRKRITQIFPSLLRMRRAQRKFFFYSQMRLDGSRYAKTQAAEPLPVCIFQADSLLFNDKTGFDMMYQMNKVHNLRIAASPVNGVVIRPGETFSFWKLVGPAENKAEYKDGLSVVDGKLVAVPGGGLCQLSNLLFWMFIHTPLTLVERHAHMVKDFPSQDRDQPDGVDATVSEGWLDLKVENHTDQSFQIELAFNDTHLRGRILAERALPYRYDIVNRDKRFFQKGGRIYERVTVCRRTLRSGADDVESELPLYTDVFEIGYALPDSTEIEAL